MSLKDLLVVVDSTADAALRLRLAADLAHRHGSRLTALYVWELTQTQLAERGTAELGLVSAEELDRLNRRIEARIDDAAERLRLALARLRDERDLMTEWMSVDGPAAFVVAQHARYADLCILGPPAAADDTFTDYTFSEALLFATGRPVLFVPPLPSLETLGRHIAVAWNSSRPAARAVNDALPLIERSERTTVITVNPSFSINRHRALPTERMVEHLRRHGAATDLVEIENVPAGSIADALQNKAREIGADLLVAGAFGHPKLWEKLLGGVTRDLLDRMALRVFMSH
jgi:nucleotide-binding universal stress UspA family protein